MGWSPQWLARRRAGDGEYRRLRVLTIGGPDAVGQPTWEVTGEGSDVGALYLVERGLRTAGARVSVGSWSSSVGQITVDLVGDLSGLLRVLWRGQPCVYEVAYPGTDWEPIASGVVYDYSSDGERHQLHLRDLVGALQSRLVAGSSRWALFAGLDTLIEVAVVAYSVGNTTLTTSRTQNSHADPVEIGLGRETGQRGAVYVRGDEEARFLRTYAGLDTASSGGLDYWRMTGVEASSAAQWALGTPVASGATRRISPVALLTGHPLVVALRILCSTGTGANGPMDVYPATWGFGLPAWLVDVDDALSWLASVHDSSVGQRLQWAMVVEEPQPDGLGWLARELARVGLWLTMRQGRITVRGCWAVNDTPPPPPSYGRLDADSRVGPWRLRGFTGGSDSEAYRQRLLIDRGSAISLVDDLRGRPAVETVEVDLQDWLRREGTTGTLPDGEVTARRLASWTLRTARAIDLVSAHHAAPGLACGDQVVLGEAIESGGYSPDGLLGRTAMVVAVDADYDRRRTSIRLAVPGWAPAPAVDETGVA